MAAGKKPRAGAGIPESLAGLLTGIRTKIFNVEKKEMAALLHKVARDPDLTATLRRYDDIRGVEERTRNLFFDHLESYSRVLGIPTAALSFVSRYQREDLKEARKVAQQMLDLVQKAEDEGRKRFTIEDLHYLAHMINLPPDKVPNRPPLPPLESEEPSRMDAQKKRYQRLGEEPTDGDSLFDRGEED